MNAADWHLRYERDRRADLIRAARHRDLAASLAHARGRAHEQSPRERRVWSALARAHMRWTPPLAR